MQLAIDDLRNLSQRGIVAPPPLLQEDRHRNRSRPVHLGYGRIIEESASAGLEWTPIGV